MAKSQITYSDQELELLLDDLESDRAERKQSWSGDAPDKGRQAICAFANDLPNHNKPGVLFIGAKDDGSASGIKVTDQLLITLADIKTDGKILPPPVIVVEKRRLKEAEMAVVTVQPADAPPVRYDGRIWIRIGARRGIAIAQDERILNEKRRFRDQPYDVQSLPSARLSDLSRLFFEEEYLPNAYASDILAENGRTYEQRLAACKMIETVDEPTPTVLGVLVLGKTPRNQVPGAYIQFLRVDGLDWADPVIDAAVIEGPLAQLLRRIDEKVDAHNRIAVDVTSQDTEVRRPDYPRAALQQLIRNAVMHRSYEHTNAPIRVYWFQDRIEISSPGGPYGQVTAENFGQPGLTDYRNPNLAEAMRVLGFVQKFGVGLALAQAELRKNGNPPAQFRLQPTNILAIVRRKLA